MPQVILLLGQDQNYLASIVVAEGFARAKRVNVDFPAWMIESLDKEANRAV